MSVTETQREELLRKIEAADVVSPEQVADMVLAAAERGGYDAGVKQLTACVEADADERYTDGSVRM